MFSRRIEGDELKEYITSIGEWLRVQCPALFHEFTLHVKRRQARINECNDSLKKKEDDIIIIKHDILIAEKQVAKSSAILGWSGRNPIWSALIDSIFRIGTSFGPIVTTFSIAGITNPLNPFSNPEEKIGVCFLLFISFSLVQYLGWAVSKTAYGTSKKEWNTKIGKLDLKCWFFIGCLLIVLVSGLGSGTLASSMIDSSRMKLSEATGSPLAMLDNAQKFFISGVLFLFSVANLWYSYQKGSELRKMQHAQIKWQEGKAILRILSNQLSTKIEEKEKIETEINDLFEKITDWSKPEKIDREIWNMSNKNTTGVDFIGQYPGKKIEVDSFAKFKGDQAKEKDMMSKEFKPESNGHNQEGVPEQSDFW
jgi:hypothetical protein